MHIITACLWLQLIKNGIFFKFNLFKFLLATELSTHRQSRRLKDIVENWGCSYTELTHLSTIRESQWKRSFKFVGDGMSLLKILFMRTYVL